MVLSPCGSMNVKGGYPLDREVSGRSGFGQLAEVLSFASPNESTQRKGDPPHWPTSATHRPTGASCRCDLSGWLPLYLYQKGGRPASDEPFAHIRVRSHRKITPPLGSSEGKVGATAKLRWSYDQITLPLNDRSYNGMVWRPVCGPLQSGWRPMESVTCAC